jgi:hypothetical protein
MVLGGLSLQKPKKSIRTMVLKKIYTKLIYKI